MMITLHWSIAFFLVRIPPFYVLPGIENMFTTSHGLARVLSATVFGLVILKNRMEKTKIDASLYGLLVLLVGWVLVQSFGILSAVELGDYMSRYQVVVSVGLLVLPLFFVDKLRKRVLPILIITTVINLLYQLLMLISPDVYVEFATRLLYKKHYELVEINLMRARIFVETFDEGLIAIYYLVLTKKKEIGNKIWLGILNALIVFVALISNFRSRVLVLLVSLVGVFVRKMKMVRMGVMGIVLVIIITLTDRYSWSVFGFSYLDRLLLRSQREDVQTLSFRVRQIEESFRMSRYHPVVGVGLGNYYEYLPMSKANVIAFAEWGDAEQKVVNNVPHNIFAQYLSESGWIGVVGLMLGLWWLVRHDYLKWRGADNLSEFEYAYMVSFWAVFANMLVNPGTTYSYLSLLWVLRVMAR